MAHFVNQFSSNNMAADIFNYCHEGQKEYMAVNALFFPVSHTSFLTPTKF